MSITEVGARVGYEPVISPKRLNGHWLYATRVSQKHLQVISPPTVAIIEQDPAGRRIPRLVSSRANIAETGFMASSTKRIKPERE